MTAAPPRTPPRHDHPEILDDRSIDPRIVERSMRDVARCNFLFGGARAVTRELAATLRAVPNSAALLDVGTGLGDIPASAQRLARRRHVALYTVGVDSSTTLARASRRRLNATVCADAGALPFRDRSFEIVTCSQVVHHFTADTAARILGELNRVALHRVIVSDIRRTPTAIAGIWVASFLLGFHRVSRHDGVASVRRGFTPRELRDLVTRAVGIVPRVQRHLGFRVTASWTPELQLSRKER